MCSCLSLRQAAALMLELLCGSRLEAPEAEVIRKAAMPRQVLSGRHDPIAGRRFARRLAKYLDCSVVITGAPHVGTGTDILPPLSAGLCQSPVLALCYCVCGAAFDGDKLSVRTPASPRLYNQRACVTCLASPAKQPSLRF